VSPSSSPPSVGLCAVGLPLGRTLWGSLAFAPALLFLFLFFEDFPEHGLKVSGFQKPFDFLGEVPAGAQRREKNHMPVVQHREELTQAEQRLAGVLQHRRVALELLLVVTLLFLFIIFVRLRSRRRLET
jgi:hypothetical protein